MDDPLGCLFRLIWLPYQIWKTIAEQSVIGSSEMDRAAGRLCKNLAIFGSILLIALLGFGVWVVMN